MRRALRAARAQKRAWSGPRLLDARWCTEMGRPSAVNPQNGLLWWLNTGRRQIPSAPESSCTARCAGSNLIWIDPEHDLITVVRWIDKASVDGFVKLVLESVAS